MPIYEYECLECGVRFEKLQHFGDPAPESCPNGHRRIHRLLSQPAIIFKGPGFYITDNGRNGNGIPAGKRDKGKAPAIEGKEKAGASAATATESVTAAAG